MPPSGASAISVCRCRTRGKRSTLVARQRVPAAHHALDGNRVVAEPRDEPVVFRGPAWAARRERETGENESLHGTHVLMPARGAQGGPGSCAVKNVSAVARDHDG